MSTDDSPTTVPLEAFVFDVRPVRPTENKPLAVRLSFECEPTDEAILLAKRVNDKCILQISFLPEPKPDPRKNGHDPRQQVLPWETAARGEEVADA